MKITLAYSSSSDHSWMFRPCTLFYLSDQYMSYSAVIQPVIASTVYRDLLIYCVFRTETCSQISPNWRSYFSAVDHMPEILGLSLFVYGNSIVDVLGRKCIVYSDVVIYYIY